jgi:hypothetical protein
MRRGGLASSLAAAAALLVALMIVAGAAGDTLPAYSWRDGNSGYVYTCPGPPAGWRANPANPYSIGPSAASADPTTLIHQSLAGTDQETISCEYIQGTTKAIWVSANLALPVIDVNPIADFYVGCGATKIDYHQPGVTDFFLESPKAWAYVRFTDYGHALAPSDVPNFQSVARSLLDNVVPAAHKCFVDTTHSTDVPALWSYMLGFSMTGGGTNGSLSAAGQFITQGGPNARNQYKVTHLYNATGGYTLTETHAGASHKLTLTFSKPTFYYHAPTATLSMVVHVTSSTDPSCPTGSRGSISFLTIDQNGAFGQFSGRLGLCGLFTGAKVQVSTTNSYLYTGGVSSNTG